MSNSLSILTLCSMASSARIHFDFSAPASRSCCVERGERTRMKVENTYPVSLKRLEDAECDFDAPFLPTDIVLIIIFGDAFRNRFFRPIENILFFCFFMFSPCVTVSHFPISQTRQTLHLFFFILLCDV